MAHDRLPPDSRALIDGAAGEAEGFAAVIDASGKSSLVVDIGHLILTATYVRQGPDLILVGKDGLKVLIVNYFASESPPDLYTLNGARIGGDLAEVLAPGHRA